MKKNYDYIIVGAGSAGCVLANRLSASGEHSVLLLEAGGSDNNILIQMPTALSYPMASKTYNWGYNSDPEPAVDDRSITCPRGKHLRSRDNAGVRFCHENADLIRFSAFLTNRNHA